MGGRAQLGQPHADVSACNVLLSDTLHAYLSDCGFCHRVDAAASPIAVGGAAARQVLHVMTTPAID